MLFKMRTILLLLASLSAIYAHPQGVRVRVRGDHGIESAKKNAAQKITVHCPHPFPTHPGSVREPADPLPI